MCQMGSEDRERKEGKGRKRKEPMDNILDILVAAICGGIAIVTLVTLNWDSIEKTLHRRRMKRKQC